MDDTTHIQGETFLNESPLEVSSKPYPKVFTIDPTMQMD